MRLVLPRIARYPAAPLGAAWLLLLGLGGCVEPYVPEVVSANANFLVVDGFINGNGRSTFRLSRSLNVAATTAPPPEKGARLQVVDETGQRYTLTEISGGTYRSDSLVLPAGRRYQLRITTAGTGAATYESDLTPLKVTPPIDALNWKLEDDKIQLSLNTHDPAGQARYYRWSLTETWEFRSAYESHQEVIGGLVKNRVTPIYICWRTQASSLVKQGSSASLSQDALTGVPLLAPNSHDERFRYRYSLLVGQYAETAEEFAYWETLRKNTEAVGTVNDPLPSQLTGNVHRVGRPDEPVLGFVGAHTTQVKRLFVNRSELPYGQNEVFNTPYNNCTKIDTAEWLFPHEKTDPVYPHTYIFQDPAYVPIDVIYRQLVPVGMTPIAYSGGSRECLDCRLRGTNVKPSYW